MYTSTAWTEFVAFAKASGASSSRTDLHGPIDSVFLNGRHVTWDRSERRVYGTIIDVNDARTVSKLWLSEEPREWFHWLFPESTR